MKLFHGKCEALFPTALFSFSKNQLMADWSSDMRGTIELMTEDQPITGLTAPSPEAKARLQARIERVLARLGPHDKEHIIEAFLEGFAFGLEEAKTTQVDERSAYAIAACSGQAKP
jgi:hypothetical protein